MRKFTSLMLMLMVFVSTAMAQKSLLVSEGLLATQENGQYKWTSEKMTMPEGASKLRVTFLQTSNNEKPAGFPCVAIAEFYLYDKDGAVVALTEANFSSNATQGDEGKMSSICDGFTTQQDGQGAYEWYWHSQWAGNPTPYGHHYLEIDLTNVTADLSEYSIGWVTRREQASPAEVVISTGATTEEAAQNFDTAYLTSLLTSNEEAPVYFTIRNIRNGDYCASYTRNNMNLALSSTKTKASIFYFTGAVEDGLATVKIHNYAADGVCMADFGSWTEDGINWYVQLSGNNNKRGYAISKENNLTTNISWNNDANRNNKVSAYNGNDVGSTFVFVKLSATEVQNIVNEFISGPEKLTSGTSYRFRNLSGFNYMTGGDENVGTNNTAGDNTAFAYYVSPNTGAKYLYNISSKKFIGTTSTGNAKIPLSATVTSSELTFKSSTNAIYPIMISTNNGGGAINHSSWYGGIINWQGGFGDTGSADNSFSAEKVKVIDEETLATIVQLVGDYEFTIWKEQNLANLGRVGGYALDLQDEIEAVTNYEQQVAFEAANEKIAINTNSYYRLVCVNPKDQIKEGTLISDDSYNTLTFNGKSNLITAPTSASNINQIFKFEDAGNGYFYLKNMNADGYLNKIAAGTYRSAIVTTKEEACRVNIVSYANGYSNLTQYRLQNEGTALYSLFAENHPTEAIPYACAGWENGANSASAWYIVPATDIEVSINEFASIYLPFAVDVEDAKAYAIEETNSTHAVLTEKADIAANEGAILAGNGTVKLTIIDETTEDWSANKLEGTTVNKNITDAAYVLGYINEKDAPAEVGFGVAIMNQLDGTAWKNNANKAYLPMPAGAEGIKSFSFRFEGEGTTSIENVESAEAVKAIFDLTGRRVEAVTAPGIYIVNGKKVLVK